MTGKANNTMAAKVIHKKSGNIHFNHTSYRILAMARTPMVTPLVGMIRLEIPSPNWKANTATCRLMPKRSLKGAMMGMVSAACPDPLGTKKFRKLWSTNMISTEMPRGSPAAALAIPFNKVSMIFPSEATTMSPLAKAMTSAGTNMSLAPA